MANVKDLNISQVQLLYLLHIFSNVFINLYYMGFFCKKVGFLWTIRGLFKAVCLFLFIFLNLNGNKISFYKISLFPSSLLSPPSPYFFFLCYYGSIPYDWGGGGLKLIKIFSQALAHLCCSLLHFSGVSVRSSCRHCHLPT